MSEKSVNIVFMGTPEFAVPTLEKLHSEFGVKAVVTIPDKPKGRGKQMQSSDVKLKALELGLPVLQPEKLKDESFINELKSYEPDIIVVLAFRILPEEVFKIARIATFNIHGSLLPAYRGAAPINWAIINGEKKTGLTSFILEKKVDTGNILFQKTVPITDNMTDGDLHDLLMPLAADMAVDTCNSLLSGEYQLLPQDDSKASPAPKIFPEMCEIKWNQHARELCYFINGMSPFPGAWTTWNGERLKIIRAAFSACSKGIPGEFSIAQNSFLVQCDKGIISILELQLPGKKIMKTVDFLRGYRGEMSGKFE
jgi:methionyl-tRNA formyltransferase